MSYAALLPMLLTVCIGYLGSFAWTFYVSLTSSRSIATNKLVGMAQYERLFANERWMLSLQNLALYGVLFIVACMVIGFLLAAAIDRQVAGEGALRTVFLYPYAMSFVATGLVWQWILTPGGIPGLEIDWLFDQDLVLYTVVLASVWQASGFVMALMLAGLRGVDPEIWKAARLDGIPTWRVYVSIVPTLATVFILLATKVVKLYDAVVSMTQGGPGTASEVPAKFIMDHLFLRANIGLASAGAVVLLLTVLALLAPWAYARSRRKAA
jgi:glucose/mannose transport system permease protein